MSGGAGQLVDASDEPGPPGGLEDVRPAVAEAVQPVDGGIVHVEGGGAPRRQHPQGRLLSLHTGQAVLDPGHFGGEAVDLGLGLPVTGRGVLHMLLQVVAARRARIHTFSGQGRGYRSAEAGEQDQPGSEES